MKILAFETSCDDTGVAILHDRKVISNIIKKQNHTKTGGVVPEVAARNHTKNIIPAMKEALNEANLSLEEIDTFVYSSEPGLLSCIVSSEIIAKTLAKIFDKKLVAVNHIKSHIFSTFLGYENEEVEFPILTLTASGGHSEIILSKNFSCHEKLAKTIDDSAGEVFDKVARFLGLQYPGGPEIEKYAKQGNHDFYKLPDPMKNSVDFSFSGLKSAVRRIVIEQMPLDEKKIADISASFEETITENMISKLEKVLLKSKEKIKILQISGGCSANKRLQKKLIKLAKKYKKKYKFPKKKFCMDNAAMSGLQTFFLIS